MPGKLFHSHMCWRSGVAEHLLAGSFPGPFGLEPVPIAPQILQALVWEAGHFQGCSSTDRRPQRVPSPKCSTSCHAAACALALVIFQCRSGSELPARQPECDTSLDCWNSPGDGEPEPRSVSTFLATIEIGLNEHHSSANNVEAQSSTRSEALKRTITWELLRVVTLGHLVFPVLPNGVLPLPCLMSFRGIRQVQAGACLEPLDAFDDASENSA